MSIKHLSLFCLSITLCTFSLHSEPATVTVDLDKKHSQVMMKFRKCPEICASGSSQFSRNGLKYLIEQFGGKEGICIVDLRQEPHGYHGNMPISWKRKGDWIYAGMHHLEIEEQQKKRLQQLVKKKAKQKRVKSVSTEAELCCQHGVSYIRIPVKDHHHPSDYEVNRFLSHVCTLERNTWFHFHCFAGIGRTSLFLIMYHSMKSAKTKSLEEIVAEQVAIGGINLLYEPEDLSTWQKNEWERKQFLVKFYHYCKNNNDNFQTPFQS